MAKPTNISSNWTLFLKIFLPIFWGTFFGAMTLAFWLSKAAYVGDLSINAFRLLMTSFFLTGMAVFYFSVMQLKRVEVDENFIYVSNYKKTARYPFHNIEKIEEASYWLFKIIHLSFKKSGIFGKKVVFLANQFRLLEILEKHAVLEALYRKE